MNPLYSFFTVVFGGLSIGIIVGAISAFIVKFTEHVRVIEPLIIFSTAYFAFILSECIHWSGIISLIGCGIVQKRYTFLNISREVPGGEKSTSKFKSKNIVHHM